jgi:hypothetical protein
MATYDFALLGAPNNTIRVFEVRALNNRANVVGSGWDVTESGNDKRVLFWDKNVPKIVAYDVWGVDINDAGEVLCSSTFASGVYRDGQLHPIFNPGIYHVQSYSINKNGLVTGNMGTVDAAGGLFIYDSRAMSPVRVITTGDGRAINNQDQIAAISSFVEGVFQYDGTERALLVENVSKPDPDVRDLGVVMSVNALNDSGQVVGKRMADGNSEPSAYLCETSNEIAQFHDLGVLPGYIKSEAASINSKGDIAGTCSQPQGSSAFLRLAEGNMQDLNGLIPSDTGWHLDTAADINDLGQIVGLCHKADGINGNYASDAFYLLTHHIPLDYQRLVGQVYALWGSGGTHVIFGPGGKPVPVDPRIFWTELSPEKQDQLIRIAVGTLASFAQLHSREEIELGAINLIRGALDRLSMTDGRKGNE